MTRMRSHAEPCYLLERNLVLHVYFSALTAHFGHWLVERRRGRIGQKTAGGGWADRRSGEKKLPATEAGSRHARDAARDPGRSHKRLAETGFFWTAQHRFYRTGESDGPSWSSGPGPSHLGNFPTGLTASGVPGVVASLVSCCASSPITAPRARAAASARWQAGGATLSATDGSSGIWENHPTMDGSRGALLPIVTGFRLRATQARCGSSGMA